MHCDLPRLRTLALSSKRNTCDEMLCICGLYMDLNTISSPCGFQCSFHMRSDAVATEEGHASDGSVHLKGVDHIRSPLIANSVVCQVDLIQGAVGPDCFRKRPITPSSPISLCSINALLGAHCGSRGKGFFAPSCHVFIPCLWLGRNLTALLQLNRTCGPHAQQCKDERVFFSIH